MAQEIERKFLVRSDAWRALGTPQTIRQGYLSLEPARTVRVRLRDGVGTLTVKGANVGLARAEFEWRIDAAEAEAMLDGLCLRPLLEKRRTEILFAGHVWEVDEFFGDNAGLVVAEIELASAEQAFELPPWVGAEVSHDRRYYNSQLQQRPYRTW